MGAWDGVGQTWNNGSWDLNSAGAAPWTYQAALGVHPNGTNSAPTIGGVADPTNEHWAIRRWVASELTEDTAVTIIWKVRKTNLANQGVTGMLFINGQLVDSKSIEGNDGTGEERRYRTTLKQNDIVDLALTPESPAGDRFDYSDGSETWFWVDTRPVPADIQISNPTFDPENGTFTFTWNSQAGTTYNIWVSSDLAAGWTSLEAVPSGGAETTYTETLPTPRPTVRFYRISPQ